MDRDAGWLRLAPSSHTHHTALILYRRRHVLSPTVPWGENIFIFILSTNI